LTVHLFTTWLTEYFKSPVENYRLGKKTAFKILLRTNNAPGHSSLPMERYSEMNVICMPVNRASILQPMGLGVILTFRCYYLRNTFGKGRGGIDSDFSDGFGKVL
jgi:hypothetical protein